MPILHYEVEGYKHPEHFMESVFDAFKNRRRLEISALPIELDDVSARRGDTAPFIGTLEILGVYGPVGDTRVEGPLFIDGTKRAYVVIEVTTSVHFTADV